MVEIDLDLSSQVIVLDVTIEGRIIETIKMALDTGATFTMIPWRLAESLGLKPEITEERTEIITASGTELVPIVTLPIMRVLGKEARNVKTALHDLPERGYVDGLLGLSFLKNFDIRLNFKKRTIAIE